MVNSLSFFDLKKYSKTNPIIPFYHIVSDEDVPHIRHLYTYRNINQFKEDLDFFGQNYTPISLQDLIHSLNNSKPLPDKAILLTFDDGLREIYDVIAPILKEKGFPAAFFLNTAFLDNRDLFYRFKASLLIDHLQKTGENSYLDRVRDIFGKSKINYTDFKINILKIDESQKHILDEIASAVEVDFNKYLKKYQPYLSTDQVEKLIANGFAVGAHSIDHPHYNLLTLEDQIRQTKESVRFVRDKFSLNYGAFAFPFNDIGISKKYFEEVFNNGTIDVSFGTSGFVEDIYFRNIQRFSMEGTLASAQEILSNQYKNEIIRNIYDKNKMARP